MINDGVREAFYEYDKHRKKLLRYPRKRVDGNKANRVCPINNNEIGSVWLRSTLSFHKNESLLLFFIFRRVASGHIEYASLLRTRLHIRAVRVTSHGIRFSFRGPHFSTRKISKFLGCDSFCVTVTRNKAEGLVFYQQ